MMSKKSGFTLVELLLVAGLSVILVGASLTLFFTSAKAVKSSLTIGMKKFGIALTERQIIDDMNKAYARNIDTSLALLHVDSDNQNVYYQIITGKEGDTDFLKNGRVILGDGNVEGRYLRLGMEQIDGKHCLIRQTGTYSSGGFSTDDQTQTTVLLKDIDLFQVKGFDASFQHEVSDAPSALKFYIRWLDGEVSYEKEFWSLLHN